MDIGTNEGYAMAIIAGQTSLSVDLLRARAEAIYELILEKGIRPSGKVLVSIPDETDLLPVLWALLKGRVTCILPSPDNNEMDLTDLGWLNQASYIIRSSPVDLTSFESLPLSNASGGRGDETPFLPFIFYDKTANNRYPETITLPVLSDFFERLDDTIQPTREDRMLLSRALPFSRRVLELIWASSRSLPVVMSSLSADSDLSLYMHSTGQFQMDFGLFHFGSYIESSGQEKYKLLFDTVRFADDNGFCSVWTPERHFNEFGGLFPNPSVLSAAIAVATSHVQIRSGSLVSPLHHTVRIAEDWSLVDNLSGGRVAISFASGWQCDDFIFFPDNYSARHDLMMQQIKEVRHLWKGGKVRCRNGLDKDIEVSIFPKPVQKELPVWITVSGRKDTFIDAGSIGANILTHLLWQDTDELIEKIALYRESLQENGFDPRSGKVTVMVHTFLGSRNEVVREKVRGPLKEYIRTSTQLIQSMVRSNVAAANAKEVGGRYGSLDGDIQPSLMDELLEIAFNRFFDQAGLLGTVEKAGNLIRKLKSYDVDEVAALIDFGLGREDIMEGLTYLNELKNLYGGQTPSGYPITIVHCTLPELKTASPDGNVARLLDAQHTILVEPGDVGGLPRALSGKIRVINATYDIESLPDERALFTSSLSNEF